MRQYLVCKYRPDDKRAYTFHNDGEQLRTGDVAKVSARNGHGWVRVHVVDAVEKPEYETKPILGRLEDNPKDLLDG